MTLLPRDRLPLGIPLKTWATGVFKCFFRASLVDSVWENIRILDHRVKEQKTNGCNGCVQPMSQRECCRHWICIGRSTNRKGFFPSAFPTHQWIMPERNQNFIVPVMRLDNSYLLIVLILLHLSMITFVFVSMRISTKSAKNFIWLLISIWQNLREIPQALWQISFRWNFHILPPKGPFQKGKFIFQLLIFRGENLRRETKNPHF